ncbi:MAG: hypothetical protein U0271_42965 [Polyangiaceae bacterium]
MRALDLRRALVSPLFVASALTLALNDHVLKGSGLVPGLVTGKLSDVAGMFVAPPLLAWMLRLRTRRGLAVAHASTGAGFALLELSTRATGALDAAYTLFGSRWRSTSDWTDLLVLPLLFASYFAYARIAGRATSASPSGGRTAWVAAVGLAICLGSNYLPPKPGDYQCSGPETDCDADGFDEDVDCNDYDGTINPGAGNCPGSGEFACDDGIDNDLNGVVDCDDEACAEVCADAIASCDVATEYDVTVVKTIDGSTVTAGTWAHEGSCGGADAPESVFVVYHYQPATVTISVPPGHVVYARTRCDAPTTELGCATEEEGSLTIASPGVFELFVDAADALSASDFEITVDVATPSFCGDGVLDADEACDDGGSQSGDGCDAACFVEDGLACGLATQLSLGTAATTFEGATRFVTSSCNASATDVEAPFWFMPEADGTLTIQATAEQPLSIVTTEGCDGVTPTETGCTPYPDVAGTVELSVPATTGSPIGIYVEAQAGLDPATPLAMNLSLSP